MSAQLVFVIFAMIIAFALITVALYFGYVKPNTDKLQNENETLKTENSKLKSEVSSLEYKSAAAYKTMNNAGLSRFMGTGKNVQGKKIGFMFLPRNDDEPRKEGDFVQNLAKPIKKGDVFRLGIIGSSVNFSDAYINVLNNKKTVDIDDPTKTTRIPLQSYTIPNFIEMQSPVDFNYIHSIFITPTSGLNLSQFTLEVKEGDVYKNNIGNNSIINQGVNPVNEKTKQNFNPDFPFCYTETIGSMNSNFYCGQKQQKSSEIGNCNVNVSQGKQDFTCNST